MLFKNSKFTAAGHFRKPLLAYHALASLLFGALTNAIFLGSRYQSETWIFFSFTFLSLILYADTFLLLGFLIQKIVGWYPKVEQTIKRMLVMFTAASLVSALLATGTACLYSLISIQEVSISLSSIAAMFALSLGTTSLFCLIAGFDYLHAEWQRTERKKEQLKNTVQQQALELQKNQPDPHLLFNSLHTLCSMIGKDPAGAEQYVQELLQVYHYLLINSKTELTTLQEELTFADAYVHLLKAQFGQALNLKVAIAPAQLSMQLPPLCLQLLLNNAIKHNIVQMSKPLHIEAYTTDDGKLLVRNNLQPKTSTAASQKQELATISANYKFLAAGDPQIEESSSHFTVSLPLIHKAGQKQQKAAVPVG